MVRLMEYYQLQDLEHLKIISITIFQMHAKTFVIIYNSLFS